MALGLALDPNICKQCPSGNQCTVTQQTTEDISTSADSDHQLNSLIPTCLKTSKNTYTQHNNKFASKRLQTKTHADKNLSALHQSSTAIRSMLAAAQCKTDTHLGLAPGNCVIYVCVLLLLGVLHYLKGGFRKRRCPLSKASQDRLLKQHRRPVQGLREEGLGRRPMPTFHRLLLRMVCKMILVLWQGLLKGWCLEAHICKRQAPTSIQPFSRQQREPKSTLEVNIGILAKTTPTHMIRVWFLKGRSPPHPCLRPRESQHGWHNSLIFGI